MDITVDGLDGLLARFQQFPKDIEDKIRQLQLRLADIGIRVAKVGFANVQYDGKNDVEVDSSPEWDNDNTLIIRASGASILFIEFGAGVYGGDLHPLFGLVMPRGTYGKGYGKRRTWGFYDDAGNKVLTHGNPANRAMYDAGQEMRRQIVDIAKEVFRQ